MDNTQINLEAIIKNCQSGQLNDFGIIYDAYIKKIYAFIYQKTFNRELTEDLTSKTFLNALKNINQYDAAKANFNTWIYKIARNNVIDYYRAKKDDVTIESIFDLSSDVDIEGDVDNRLLLQQVKKQIEKLQPRQREIVLLKLWGSLSYEEISGIVGVSAGNAKMIFCRAMSVLREDLAMIVVSLLILIKIWK